MTRVRVFIASSLDGFIAGPDGDLSWLPPPPPGGTEDYGWGAFIAGIGCVLMGRGTYDAVAAMDVAWPYGDLPMLVATRRPLDDPPPGVSAVSGGVGEVVAAARSAAGDRDVYIDGGNLIRQALDAGLVDEIVVTFCPTILGAGIPLFAGVERRRSLELRAHRPLPGGLVQLTYVPPS